MRILTGLQPSGKLHIGNYFGAIEPAVRLQTQGEAFYFIANYHAMTTMESAEALQENTFNLALDFISCGLDPEHSVLFVQSAVPEVNELAWILSTVCPMGLLERCHSYKDKVAKGFQPQHALFAYPALMAADILLYDSDLVPVGKDQKQHLEVTRDLAGKMNDAFGEGLFKLPEALIAENTAVVPGLDGQKMSKSYGNTLPIFGEEKPLLKMVNKKILTDSTPLEDPKPVEGSVLLQLYRLFAGEAEYQAMVDAHLAGGVGYGTFKKQLFEAYWEYFRPARECREALLQDPAHITDVLDKGAARAREEAAKVLTRVRRAVGLGWH
ncbi:tryptophan--tRNA ligase [Akkermansia glycaniphila]|uniref:Tryptophan--tRNA ligase n=1 Tax=Akkermansia glycaniphila TaxID=1679444 RepID=A0A1C7P8X3_9BACT|nr:tryptophan--tRNA ligase [Akkermansia glycaniphila]OCA01929.1 tryptophanyl-tRNA synthetase [Akkermansia glycaniphila]SEH92045.1 trps: tryptophan--trna ligase [Akkermansia glycaniphila]